MDALTDAAHAPSISTDGPIANAALRCASRTGSTSSRTKRAVERWPYDQIRRADGPPQILRLSCEAALPLARLEISDAATQEAIAAHCKSLYAGHAAATQTWRIVFWSLAAVCSIIALALVRHPVRRRSPCADGADGGRAAHRRGGGQAGARDLRRQDVRRAPKARRPSRRWSTSSSAPGRSTSPLEAHVLSSHDTERLSRCRAERSICSTGCCRRRAIRTRSPACSPTSSGMCSTATVCARSSRPAEPRS